MTRIPPVYLGETQELSNLTNGRSHRLKYLSPSAKDQDGGRESVEGGYQEKRSKQG